MPSKQRPRRLPNNRPYWTPRQIISLLIRALLRFLQWALGPPYRYVRAGLHRLLHFFDTYYRNYTLESVEDSRIIWTAPAGKLILWAHNDGSYSLDTEARFEFLDSRPAGTIFPTLFAALTAIELHRTHDIQHIHLGRENAIVIEQSSGQPVPPHSSPAEPYHAAGDKVVWIDRIRTLGEIEEWLSIPPEHAREYTRIDDEFTDTVEPAEDNLYA